MKPAFRIGIIEQLFNGPVPSPIPLMGRLPQRLSVRSHFLAVQTLSRREGAQFRAPSRVVEPRDSIRLR